jgi:hypothetical protein
VDLSNRARHFSLCRPLAGEHFTACPGEKNGKDGKNLWSIFANIHASSNTSFIYCHPRNREVSKEQRHAQLHAQGFCFKMPKQQSHSITKCFVVTVNFREW